MARSNGITAPIGEVVFRGQSAIRVTNISIDRAMSELTATSGCEIDPWYRAVAGRSITGAFETQVLSLELEAAVMGGSILSAGTGSYIVKRETATVTGGFVVDLSDALLPADENSLYAITVNVYTASGEEPLKQVTAAPAADEFQVTSAPNGTITFHSSRAGATVRCTYAYQVASRENLQVLGANRPPYGSLLLPLCGFLSTVQGTDEPTGFYFPRVAITGGGMASAQAGATDLPRIISYNWAAAKDANDLLYKVI